MKRQMNEYVVLLKNDDACPLPGPAEAFNETVNRWVHETGANMDVIRTETQAAGISMVCTEAIARRVAESFAGKVASIQMNKENVITLPGPMPKKSRRPGFETN